jgi:hypothetical protein
VIRRPDLASGTPSGLVLQPRLGNQVVVAQHSSSVCSADVAVISNYDVPAGALGMLDLMFVAAPTTAAAVPVVGGELG